MKPIENISYHGKQYPIFEVNINLNLNGRLEPVWVSVESLQDALMIEGEWFRDEEAANIDERIYFYIPDSMADKDEQTIRLFIEEYA